MSAIVEKKKKISEQLQSMGTAILNTRQDIINETEIVNEMIDSSVGSGLKIDYHAECIKYGRQRAILRGLNGTEGTGEDGDIMFFDIDSSLYITDPSLTFPTTSSFGFEVRDDDGNDLTSYFVSITDFSKYYLTKIESTVVTSGLIVSSATSNTITSSSATWKTDEHIGRFIDIKTGDGSGQKILIISNTATTLTLFSNFSTTPSTSDTYDIINPSELASHIYNTQAYFDTPNNTTYKKVRLATSPVTGPGTDSLYTLTLVSTADIQKRPSLLSGTRLRHDDGSFTLNNTSYDSIIIIVTTEGVKLNSNWNHLTQDPESSPYATTLNPTDFNNLLAFANPTYADDIIKSTDPSNVSTAEPGPSDNYPNVKKNPFFPALDADGNPQGDDPFIGNVVGTDEGIFVDGDTQSGTYKWSSHNDLKWAYKLKPAANGDIVENSVDTFRDGLTATKDFSGTAVYVIPNDETPGGGTYKVYKNGYWDSEWTDTDYVYEIVLNYVDGTGGPWIGNDTINSQTKFSCYFNDVQTLIDDHINHVKSQISKLFIFTNNIDNDKQDSEFYNDSTSFRDNKINPLLTYHNAFDPISGRPTYVTTTMVALKTAAAVDAQTYESSVGYYAATNTRITTIETTIVGTPTTSGSYSKEIYDTCKSATNRSTGFLRGTPSSINSINGLYDAIREKQAEYQVYP